MQQSVYIDEKKELFLSITTKKAAITKTELSRASLYILNSIQKQHYYKMNSAEVEILN